MDGWKHRNDKVRFRWENKGYTDVHCHILPGVDDGSRNEKMTKEMLQIASYKALSEWLLRHILPVESIASSEETLEKALDKTREIAAQVDSNMEIYLGNELFYSPGVHDEWAQGHANHIMDTRYILVEFSPQDSYHTIYDALRTFVLKGDIPILAHAERYQAIYRKEERYEAKI